MLCRGDITYEAQEEEKCCNQVWKQLEIDYDIEQIV